MFAAGLKTSDVLEPSVASHRPRYIEPASVPEFTGETSSATEAEKPTEPTLLPEVAETAEVPTKVELKQSNILLSETKEKAEAPSTEKIVWLARSSCSFFYHRGCVLSLLPSDGIAIVRVDKPDGIKYPIQSLLFSASEGC